MSRIQGSVEGGHWGWGGVGSGPRESGETKDDGVGGAREGTEARVQGSGAGEPGHQGYRGGMQGLGLWSRGSGGPGVWRAVGRGASGPGCRGPWYRRQGCLGPGAGGPWGIPARGQACPGMGGGCGTGWGAGVGMTGGRESRVPGVGAGMEVGVQFREAGRQDGAPGGAGGCVIGPGAAGVWCPGSQEMGKGGLG